MQGKKICNAKKLQKRLVMVAGGRVEKPVWTRCKGTGVRGSH